MNNKFLKTFLTLLIFINFISYHCFANVDKKPSILFIYFNDGVSFDDHNFDQISEFYKLAFPDHEVIPIQIYVNRMGFFEKYYRNKLIEKISQLVSPDHEITHLFIGTHGDSKTGFLGLNSKNSVTRLGYIGSFDETEPDANFRKIFDSIKNRFSRKLSIVLESCSTMCGTDKQKKRRAGSLLRYFNADQGQLYGAYTPESNAYFYEEGLQNNSLRWKQLMPTLNSLKFIMPFVTVSSYLGLIWANVVFRSTMGWELNPTYTALAFGGMSPFIMAIAQLKILSDIVSEQNVNLGSIFYFDSQGDLVVENISKRLKNLARIHNVPNTCQFYLK